MLSIQQMNYIVILSEQRHFQKASELCFVTQPTLSMQVKKAEDELGNVIFDRSRSPLELTDFGEKLVPIIREILNENGKIETLIQQLKGNYKEQINIGIIPTVASYLVPDMFSIWKESAKGVQLNMEEQKTEDLLVSLDRKSIDLAILAGPYSDVKTRTIPIYREEILAYTSETEDEGILTDSLMEMHPWLLSKGNCLRTQMVSFCQLKEERDSQEWNYEGGNLELLLKMVDLHGGYTLVPEFYKLNEQQKSNLKHIQTVNYNTVPAREIIALVPNRSLKWSTIERLLRDIQLSYNKGTKDNLEVLNWKG